MSPRRRLLRSMLVPSLLAATAFPARATEVPFGARQTIRTGNVSAFASAAPGHLDGDANVDLAASFGGDSEAGKLISDGNASPSFTYTALSSALAGAGPVVIEDVDGDESADVIVGATGSIRWYDVSGGGTETVIVSSSGEGYRALAAGFVDFSSFGVVAALETSDDVVLYEETSPGTWGSQTVFDGDGTSCPVSVAVGNLDSDFDLEIVVASFCDDTIRWFEPFTGTAFFAGFFESTLTSSASGAHGVAVGNLDGDGDTDIVAVSYFDDTVRWFENDGSASFTEHVIATTAAGPVSVTTADLDGDGDVDVVVGGDGRVRYYENLAGDGTTWAEHLVGPDPGFPDLWHVAVADLDGDGQLDIVTTSDAGVVGWHENLCDGFDLDEDGLLASCDNCPTTNNPDQADDDADGTGNACDPCLTDADNDSDGDGICDDGDGDGSPGNAPCPDGVISGCDDNCPGGSTPVDDNPDQADGDGDGVGDACDPCPTDGSNDPDGDGVCHDGDGDGSVGSNPCNDSAISCDDNCRTTSNPGQEDFDDDGFGDACDGDDDDDGVADTSDNCPFGPLPADPDQTDTDGDGDGDVCDGDDDDDGVADGSDNCPLGPGPFPADPDQTDTDGDGEGDVCDADDDNDGVDDIDDPTDTDPTTCGDSDLDACDDCTNQVDGLGPLSDADPFDDGTDTDGDGICDLGESDIDGDGCPDVIDDAPLVPSSDTDSDGAPDDCDADDDDDGRDDVDDPTDTDPTTCGDSDADTCDDCANQVDGLGPLSDFDPSDDGTDTDGDGSCDAGDTDDDNDGAPDGSDSAPLDPTTCGDSDSDTCDDCANQVDGLGPLSDFDPADDGTDTDGDGSCDAGDTDDDNDGVGDTADAAPFDPTACSDTDGDGCDDCSVQVDGFGPLSDFDPADDGADADGDGVCDGADACAGTPSGCTVDTAGCPSDADFDGACDDLDECADTPVGCSVDAVGCESDPDGDGVCDGVDDCPSTATGCSVDAAGCDTDTDGDGTCDDLDGCPADPRKTAPGLCGCGLTDTDSDGDGTPNCDDACPFDPGKLTPGACGCGVADVDTDGDETLDCEDGCPGDAAKIDPGTCGCSVPETDRDDDGVLDCEDGCPVDPGKSAPGTCGCGVPDEDLDGDGEVDCADACPDDPDKSAPGTCGCGVPDDDPDGDGFPDCIDDCPSDPEKVSAGACGCGVVDFDSDGDGVLDCLDGCPEDPGKADPGQCGCDQPDTDFDGDGSADCADLCPDDPGKDAPGTCGCGVPDTDRDGDGSPDCVDGCPDDPSRTVPDACGCGSAGHDDDGDGIPACDDNCPDASNPGQEDTDRDGTGNRCDVCPFDALDDGDGDGACADQDNCPTVSNPGQEDSDLDGQGDACDAGQPDPVIDDVSVPLSVLSGQPLPVVVTARDPGGSVIAAIECFLDVAGPPGTGAVQLVPSPSPSVRVSKSLDLTGAAPGRHSVHARARTAAGSWSAVASADFVLTAAPIPVVLVPGYHLAEAGAHGEQVESWRRWIEEALGRQAFVALGQDSWANPLDNARGVADTVLLARAQTGASVVDVLSFDAGVFAVRAALAFMGVEEGVGTVVAVAGQHLGWGVADALHAALAEAASEGDAGARTRLAQDAMLEVLTGHGAAAFTDLVGTPDEVPDVRFVLLAGERTGSGADDSVTVASATGLSGPNVATAVYSTVGLPRPMHFALTTDRTFFDAFVAPALTGEGAIGLLAAAPGRAGAAASVRPRSQVLAAQTSGDFTSQVLVTEEESLTFTQYAIDTGIGVSVQSPSGRLFTPEDAEVEERVAFADGSSADGLSFVQYTLTEPEPGEWDFNVTSGTSGFTFGRLGRVGGVELTVGVSGSTFVLGAPVVVGASLVPAGASVTRAEVAFLSPDGVASVVPLRDDGALPDSQAGDGTGVARFVLPTRFAAAGRWTASVRVEGVDAGRPFSVGATVQFDATRGEIRSTDAFTEAFQDTDGDSVTDVVQVGVGLQVSESGTFVVSGRLAGPSGEAAGEASLLLPDATVGLSQAVLSFDATEVSAGGTSGRFALSELVLGRVDDVPVVVERRDNPFTTSPIAIDELAQDGHPRLRLLTPNAETPLVRQAFELVWEDADPDSAATVSFFLDDDPSGFDGDPIPGAQGIPENDETDRRTINVSGLPEGSYHVYGVIVDETSSERTYASAPLRIGADRDGDGLLDSYEDPAGLDGDRYDIEADQDVDGLTNGLEAAIGTSPVLRDTDFGGESDGREVKYGREPLLAGDDVVLPFGAVLGDVAPRVLPDGEVNIGDVVVLLRYSAGIEVPSALQEVRGDVAPSVVVDATSRPQLAHRIGNGSVDVGDVVLALRQSVQLIRVVER